MTTSADGHEVQIDGRSMHQYELQSDDDCDSENSFGSYDDDEHAADEEESTDANSDANIEVISLPPAYSDEEYPQSTSILANMDPKSPPVVLQHTLATETESALKPKLSGRPTRMCVVCKVSPAYSRGRVSYPTCGLACASKMSDLKAPITSPNKFLPRGIAPSSGSQSETSYMLQGSVDDPSPSQSASQIRMCDVCHVRPRARNTGRIYRTCGFTCDAALAKSQSSKLEGNVPILDPALLALLSQQLSLSDGSPGAHRSPQQPSRAYIYNSHDQNSPHEHSQSPPGVRRRQAAPSDRRHPSRVYQSCVVCRVLCRDGRYVTCGIKCTERLCKRGSSNPKMCDYCHRRPKFPGYDQCGKTCGDNASKACLLCRCRPKFGRYPLCGRTCKKIATKWTPLILEARPGHITYNEVERRFKKAWKGGSDCPPIKKIYKIIENKDFLLPYDRYKKLFGNEVFRYHGTTRSCTLGSQGNTRLCSSTTCALCSILRTSFKVSLAKSSGAFGAGIYSSSAANKAYGYSNGAVLLTKVVLGNVYNVTGWNQVMSCPSGHNSVVFDRQKGTLNETIVYTDDAIRPVFLIVF